MVALALALAPGAYGAALTRLGDMYVADADAFPPGAPGGVIGVDQFTGARLTVSENQAPPGAPTFAGPYGIAVEPDGQLAVSGAFAGADLVRIDPATGRRARLARDPIFGSTRGLAVEPRGDLLVVNQGGEGTGIYRVNPASGRPTALSTTTVPEGDPTSFVDPYGIALAEDGGIYVADANAFDGGGGVIRVDPDTGARRAVSHNGLPAGGPNFVDPTGIAVEAGGDLVVADQNAAPGGAVIRVDDATGARTIVSQNAAPAGATNFGAPWNLAVAADGDLLVADTEAFGGGGGVIRVDEATGTRTAVSHNAAPAGAPEFVTPYALALKPIVITAVHPGPRTFPVDRGARAERPVAAGVRGGTTFTFRLSDPARVLFTIQRRVGGRVVAGQCVALTRANRRSPSCIRDVTVGRFALSGRRGRNRKRFSGRIGRRVLGAGVYQAILTARDPAGHRSVPVSAPFTVIRRGSVTE